MPDDRARSAAEHTLAPLLEGLERHGNAPAVLSHRGEVSETLGFAQLAETVQRLAAGIDAADGLQRGERAVLIAGASAAWIICALGLIRAGRVPVPVDVQMGEDNLAHVLKDSGARWVFTQRGLVERIEGLELEQAPRLWLLDAAEDEERGWRELLATQADGQRAPDVDFEPDQEAVLFYTSGTTGRPKGVPLSHRNLAFQLTSIGQLDMLQRDDRVLLPLPLHHVYPFVVGMLAPLSLAVPVVLPRSLTGPQVTRALKDTQATLIVGIPRLYEALFEAVQHQVATAGRLARWWLDASLAVSGWFARHAHLQIGKRLLRPVHRGLGPSLRLLASGGAALAPALQQRLEAMGWQVISGYGLTETSPLLTVKRPGEGPPGCAGRAVPGIELRIAEPAGEDAREERPTPEGYGELLARGPGVFAGYLGLPDKTAEVLDDDGWFATGDLGRLDENGFLHLAGRASTMLVTAGGENVQPEDVEAVYERHPLIQEVGVLQHEDKLVGLVVPDPQHAGERSLEGLEDEVRSALDEAGRDLASYQRLDDFALTRTQLERTRLGKLRRHLLAERFSEAKQSPAETQPPSPEDAISGEDRNLLEDPVADAAWSLLRERFEEQYFTPDSSLRYDLGVDSLDWLDLALALRDATGVELDDEAIGRVETVRDLLQELLEAEPAEQDRASPFEQPESVLSEEELERLRHPGRLSAALAAALYALDRWLLRGLFRLEVEGADRLPGPGRAFVLAPNHVSYLDPLAIAAALDPAQLDDTYWGGWTGAVFDTRFKRGLARIVRVLPIDPAAGARRNLAFAAAVLKLRRNLVWFPEGRRSSDGQLQEFRQGIGLLLEHLDAPVVPVAVHGTYEALPTGRHWPRFRRVRVHFGEPLEPDELADAGEGEETAERIVTGLHRRLQALLEGGDGSS